MHDAIVLAAIEGKLTGERNVKMHPTHDKISLIFISNKNEKMVRYRICSNFFITTFYNYF